MEGRPVRFSPVPSRDDNPNDKFRILSVDGGGIRGLISALVLAELERKVQALAGDDKRLSDYFHLFAGTSTGGLIALSLTAPGKGVSAKELALFYTEDGPGIFHRDLLWRLTTLGGWIGPKHSLGPLQKAVENRLGDSTIGSALRDLVITSYDMTAREPYFFKRWRARNSEDRNPSIVDAALATSAAPTYFPSHPHQGRALVDGGVFAANPAIAAIAEALKRSEDEPANLTPDDLLVVSVGTGEYEVPFSQKKVSGWGNLGWIMPGDAEPPLVEAFLGGSTDAADHWAHMLLNHPTGAPPPQPTDIGRGPRFFRWQATLDSWIEMDDASQKNLEELLPAAASDLITSRATELDEIAKRVTSFAPLPPDPA
jgi:predicted acylesterase/phospholipase RssA